MDFLLAEINKKDKQLQESNILKPGKKYFNRGDLAAKQTDEYWKKHKRLKLNEDEDSGHDSAPESSTSGGSKQERLLPRKEVIRRLRERSEPILLFGETEAEAYQRLKKLEMLMPEVTKGFKNDFKAAMDRVDQEYLNEIIKSDSANTEKLKAIDVKVKDDGVTHDEIQKLAENMGKGDTELDSEVVLKFLKLILKCWGDELNSRAVDAKRDFRGKLASATHSQTVTYIKPLFRSLKKKNTEPLILGCLTEIVGYMLERDYLRANDAYLEMAIGNAPWPIGVTMVGIHARTGREKISARNVAHVLNDETQRKYIQAVKRLMSKCQVYFPTDPSKMVNYEGEIH